MAQETLRECRKDNVPKLAAALSYLTIFSMAPLLVISVALAGLFFGRDAAQGRIVGEIAGLVGPEGARLVETAITNLYTDRAGPLATLVSIVTLFLTATAAFGDLHDSLNTMWGVKARSTGSSILRLVRHRVLSFGLVLATGFLLLVSLVASAGITALNEYWGASLALPPGVLEGANLVISLLMVFVLFSLMYKVLPDVRLSWQEVRIGAMATTVLFVIGKWLIGLYLGKSATASMFGAAGSLAILLLWVYYSAQIFFLGAEFTYVYTKRFGS